MIADVLETVTGLRGGEGVEAGLEPVGKAVGDFDGFVQCVFRGVDAFERHAVPVEGEVAVQLDLGFAAGQGLGTVDLDRVVILRRRRASEQQHAYQEEQAQSRGTTSSPLGCPHAQSFRGIRVGGSRNSLIGPLARVLAE